MRIEIREFANKKYQVWVDGKVLYLKLDLYSEKEPELLGSHQSHHSFLYYNTYDDAARAARLYKDYHDGVTVIKIHLLDLAD